MQYKSKVEERFTDFNYNFLYLGHKRKNRRTILSIRCLGCNDILEKEQFNLLNKSNKIICYTCTGRKYPKRITKNEIISKCESSGSKYISHERNNKLQLLVEFSCDCGINCVRDYYGLDIIKCPDCNMNNRSWEHQFKEEDIRQWMIDNGLTPTFDTYDGKNANTPLEYICICGDEYTIRYSRRQENDDSWKPMCKKCAMIKKTSKENHWNWKGGLTGYRKKHKKSTTWSRNVKKLYDNTCVVTGQTHSLVSHHLNAFTTYTDNRDELSNGVCISSDIHKEFHQKYDSYKGTCTKEDFVEFYSIKTGRDFKKILENINSKLEFIKSIE